MRAMANPVSARGASLSSDYVRNPHYALDCAVDQSAPTYAAPSNMLVTDPSSNTS